MSLFLHFQKHDMAPIVFKLLHGRMKGQAFVTFDSTYDIVTKYDICYLWPQFNDICCDNSTKLDVIIYSWYGAVF